MQILSFLFMTACKSNVTLQAQNKDETTLKNLKPEIIANHQELSSFFLRLQVIMVFERANLSLQWRNTCV